MIQRPLYTGNGVSLSPVKTDGRRESGFVRLTADEGKAITNGVIITDCKDVPALDVGSWADCEMREFDDELTDSEALEIILGGALYDEK